jgi:hypothetical protein
MKHSVEKCYNQAAVAALKAETHLGIDITPSPVMGSSGA